MFRGVVSKGGYLHPINHRDRETDLKASAVLIMKCRYSGSIDESEYQDSIIRMP